MSDYNPRFNDLFNAAIEGLTEFHIILNLPLVVDTIKSAVYQSYQDSGDNQHDYAGIRDKVEAAASNNQVFAEVAQRLFVIYSPNEAAINGGSGFWPGNEGWVDDAGDVSLFSAQDKDDLNPPQSTGGDAVWVSVSDMNNQFGTNTIALIANYIETNNIIERLKNQPTKLAV